MKAAAASKSGVFFMKPIPSPDRAGVLNETAIGAVAGRVASWWHEAVTDRLGAVRGVACPWVRGVGAAGRAARRGCLPVGARDTRGRRAGQRRKRARQGGPARPARPG